MKINNFSYHFRQNKLIYLFSLFVFILYLIKLSYFPVFADEAIYINWADRIFNRFEGPFISLNDGKPPLFIWMIIFWSRIIKNNLFFSARFASVFLFFIFNLFTLFVFKKYYQLKQGFIFLILLCFSPFIFFHTRMALMDSALAVFLSTGLLFWLTPKIKSYYLFSGIFFGLAYWAKTPAMFLIPFPLISALIFDRSKNKFTHALISILISLSLIYLLKISVFFPQLFARSKDFTFSISDIFAGESDHIFANTRDFFLWITIYHSYLYFLAPLLGIFYAIKNKNKTILNLTLATVIFILPFIFFGKVVSPRYFVPPVFFLSIIASYALIQIKKNKVIIFFLSIILFIPIFKDIKLLTNYLDFKFPRPDEYQYLKEWSSGIGIKESIDYFSTIAQTQKIKVLTEGYFGTTPDGLFIYYTNLPQNIKNNLTIVGVGDLRTDAFKSEFTTGNFSHIYYLGNSHRINPVDIKENNLNLIKTYPKKDNYSALQIYELAN